MSDKRPARDTSGHIYKKLRTDGTVDSAPINQSDYDTVNKFVKTVFPKATRVQRELEQTMKRTFVLGRFQHESKKVDLSKSANLQGSSSGISRKVRLRLEKKVPEELKYEDFVPLNALWKEYICDLIKDEKKVQDIQARLNRADFHGALINVHFSNCKDYMGLKGIVLKETKNTFIVVTSANKTKTIPKPENVFNIHLENPEGVIQIAGNSLKTKPAERASKRVKGIMDFISQKAYHSSLKPVKS